MMTAAIKSYADECLTGLTDEEREAIQKKIKAYIDSIPEGQKVNREALSDFVAKLLKQYGFKGDIDDMAQTLMGEAESDLSKESSTSSDAQVAYEKLKSDHTIPSFSENNSTPSDSDDEEEAIIAG
ncbi:MAG: hypothetical protein J6F30_15165 [Cellulosilyticum sp.]|nr:hypothetical protein [Cellulosilyticum sp.]